MASIARTQSEDEHRAVRRFLDGSTRVLDVGCGTGTPLDLPFTDGTFDAATSRHLIQTFTPVEAETHVAELARVIKPGGILVLVTLNWLPTFFQDPERVRPYPPSAIRTLLAGPMGGRSPALPDPPLIEEGLWLRHPPLRSLSSAHRRLDRLCTTLNRLQYRLWLRTWWKYDAYVIAFRKPS